MELVGKLLGKRYEIVEKIGKGGMATVYKAKDKTLNRYVAVKVLKDEYANDEEFIRKFQIEAQSAAALSHPNIVSIYDVANEDNIHYIVMELIEGKTLKDIINEKGKLPWQEACKIASQIASGLSVAHKNHIIHRDIKPHNIVMTKENVAKITDFGIAKAVSSSTINANSNSLGSVHYFSPEHARGGYTDEKSDIYSLGVVLYEMITGKLPFDGDTAVSIAMKHLKDEPEEPINIVPDIPKGLNDIILKAMQKAVGNRYMTASDMYKDLQKILQSPDTTSVGHILSKDDIFATQKVPVINRQMATRTVNNMQKEDTKAKNVKRKKKPSIAKVIIIRLIVLLAIFLLVAFAAFAFMNNMFGGNKEMKVVPGVIGNSYEIAKQKIEAAGFKIELLKEEESSLPKNYVIKQSVESGDTAEVNSTISVTISKGMPQVEVEDVTSFSVTSATTILTNQGLKVEVVEEESSEVLSGKVIRQNPKAGETALQGDTVTIYVSTGGENGIVVVPNLSRYSSEEEALDALQVLELIPEKHYAENSGEAEGAILWQSPEADKEVKVGTTVKFYINRLNAKNDLEVIEVVPSNDPNNSTGGNTGNATPGTGANSSSTSYKEMTILLTNLGTREKFTIRVELDGDIKNRTVILPDEEHSKSEKILTVKYPADATGKLKVYVDNELSSEQPIE